jgi:hypothetical protein
MRRISKKDREILKKYAEFRENIGKFMEVIKSEILKDYKFSADAMMHEGGTFTYLTLEVGGIEFSPGIKYSSEYVIRPVFWVSKNAFVEEKPEDHGFKQDPEFVEYYIRELRLEEGFFELGPKEQAKRLVKFYKNILEKFYSMGTVDKTRRYFIAG